LEFHSRMACVMHHGVVAQFSACESLRLIIAIGVTMSVSAFFCYAESFPVYLARFGSRQAVHKLDLFGHFIVR
jgi:hypothetical protein